VNAKRLVALVSCAFLASLLVAAPRAARGADVSGVLFPVPFTVEHALVQTDADSSQFHTDAVTDTYGGSHLVSVRPGGSRVIVDFARREITEVSVEKSTYWTLSFSQMGELSRRLAKAEQRPSAASARTPNATAKQDIRVEEVTGVGRDRLAAPGDTAPRVGTRHFRASVESGPSADVWVDGTVRLSRAALDALDSFDGDALGSAAPLTVSPAQLVGAARRAGGAFPVHVRRTLGASGGTLDDTAYSLTHLPVFPQKLLVIGDGFRRVPSPLEVMAAFAEEEASRDSSRLVK
jgi:hypothetical protein